MMVLFIAALSVGFLGSFHCVAMCGPIALALPVGNSSPLSRTVSILLYNFGRVFTYAVLGLILGFLGAGFAIFGLQQVFSVVMGAGILFAVLLPERIVSKMSLTRWASRVFYRVREKFSALFRSKNKSSLFLIGVLNGLLPCGLVYLAVAGAIATGTVFKSGIFMAAFGLGTIPVMLGLSWFGQQVSLKFRSRIQKVMPAAISVMAILMILRGLNLNIPYISPGYSKQSNTVECCEKPEVSASACENGEMKCCKKP